MKPVLIAGLLFTCLAVAPATASAFEILSYDNGNYRSDGLHSGGNTTPFAGYSWGGNPFPATYEYRAFWAFDLTDATEASAISITFLSRGAITTNTAGSSETVQFYDYNSAGTVASLVAGSTTTNPFGDQAFADLGTGTLLGAYTTVVPGTSMSMPEFTISLPQAFVEQYNAALADEGRIALGAAHTTGAFFTNHGFSWGSGIGAARLNVTQVSQTVPVPATLLLFGVGLLGLAARRRLPR